ncbi:ABC transporter ATP-binding protein [Actinophytocola sp.]|uniref:ABC transporter ATP-binding protein n=1 Tax=Actinophytocola sp. TaxID=1872138 RepID=UPI0025B97A9E|nr:ATP-binding cassette domain-containing protein [Actinophytocola sp.]
MPPAVLEVDRVAKRYGTVVACADVSFTVAPGELFGFVGSNGAGKTTILRIVLGVLAPDAGQVRLGGAPITLAARRRIGYLPEERGLYPRMRVHEHLVYLGELHGIEVNEAHRAADYWIARLGLRDRRDDQIQRLSLGNQQRVQLAAALVHDPDVLVLDEPFSGLDPVAMDTLSEVLRERAAAGAPVLFSSHQLDLVERLCDRIGIIQNGRMIAVGTVDELSADGRYELLVDAPHAPPGWADSLPGVEVLEVHNGRTRLHLRNGTDDQAVLTAALATGPVREFTRVRPTLAELYRDVVRSER